MVSKELLILQRNLRALKIVRKYTLFQLRHSSCWTQDRIVISPFKNIEIPNFTLYDYVWQNLDKWPQRTVAVCATTGRGYTYEQAFKMSNAFAANLRNKLGIRDGDAVAIMLPNIPDYPLVAMGILEAGGIITTINPVYTAHEVQRQLLMSKAKLMVTLPELTKVVRDAMQMAKLDLKIIVVKTNGDSAPNGTIAFNELSEDVHVDTSCLKKVRRSPNDVVFLPYSSGTTGLPKGVELSNRNLVANCLQIDEQQIAVHKDTTATNQDSVMTVLPFFHIYGASVIMFHKMSVGLKMVTLSKFQPQAFFEALEKYKTNILYAAPPMILLMASQGKPKHLQYLDAIINGAAPLAASDAGRLFETAKRKYDFRQGYGMTETAPVVTMTRKGSEEYDSVGNALPSTELKIVDSGMKSLGPNEIGELLIRGPQVMRGYRENPQANAEVFTVDGWFRSGDLAVVNERGIVTIKDRLKELIKVKGYQVPPAELEAVLREHPAVTDAAVVGVPHPINGEAPKAFVVIKPGQSVQAKEISEYVKERVAPYKRIYDVVFLESIPKSSAGKILRKDLKQKFC